MIVFTGKVWGEDELPLSCLYGLSGGLDLPPPVPQHGLHQGLGRLTAHPGHHVQLRHLRRGALLCGEAEVHLLWPAGHPPRPEVQLLLRLQPDRVLPPVRGPGLPLREASEALLPDEGRHEQDEQHQHQPWRTDLAAQLGQNNRQLLVQVVTLLNRPGAPLTTELLVKFSPL